MAIELPSEVAQFLNFIGIPWININVRHEARCFLGEVRDLSWSFVAAGG